MKAYYRLAISAWIALLIVAVSASLMLLVLPTVRAAACDLPNGDTNGVISAADPGGRVCCPPDAGGATQEQQCIIEKYISPTIQLVSGGVGVLVVISIMYGAFEVTTAGSDVSRSAAGRKRIIEALIGLFAYLSLVALMQFLVPGGVL